jgi:hypothetical protein
MLGFGGWPLCSELDVFLHGKQEVLAAATPNLAGRTRHGRHGENLPKTPRRRSNVRHPKLRPDRDIGLSVESIVISLSGAPGGQGRAAEPAEGDIREP